MRLAFSIRCPPNFAVACTEKVIPGGGAVPPNPALHARIPGGNRIRVSVNSSRCVDCFSVYGWWRGSSYWYSGTHRGAGTRRLWSMNCFRMYGGANRGRYRGSAFFFFGEILRCFCGGNFRFFRFRFPFFPYGFLVFARGWFAFRKEDATRRAWLHVTAHDLSLWNSGRGFFWGCSFFFAR